MQAVKNNYNLLNTKIEISKYCITSISYLFDANNIYVCYFINIENNVEKMV